MPVEMGLWRVDDKPVRLLPGGMPTEARSNCQYLWIKIF